MTLPFGVVIVIEEIVSNAFFENPHCDTLYTKQSIVFSLNVIVVCPQTKSVPVT